MTTATRTIAVAALLAPVSLTPPSAGAQPATVHSSAPKAVTSSTVDGTCRGGGDIVFTAATSAEGSTVTKELKLVEQPSFSLRAFGPGPIRINAKHMCLASVGPSKPFTALSTCKGSLWLSVVAVDRVETGLTIRWAGVFAKPGSTWTVTVSASQGGSGSAEAGRATATARRTIRGTSIFDSTPGAEIAVRAVADGGQRCSITMSRIVPRAD